MRHEVVIVGAGAAGLAAARILLSRGVLPVVLEARERLGGRIFTLQPEGCPLPVELGAEFVHGDPPETRRLLEACASVSYRVPDTHLLAVDHRLRQEPDFWKRLERVMGRLRKRRSRDRPFGDFLDEFHPFLGRESLAVAKSYVEGFHAADPGKISERALAIAEGGHPERAIARVLGGYGPWLEKIGRGVPVRMRTAVREIHWRRGDVVLLADGPEGQRTFRAQKAILTIPASLLKDRAVKLVPALDRKERALERIEMGCVIKIVLRFRRAFWEKGKTRGFSFVHSDRHELPTWWSSLPFEAPLLTGWAGGPKARALSGLPAEEVLDHALRSAASIFRVTARWARSQLEGWHFHDWQSDPYARGAYSYLAVGGVDCQKELSRPEEDTVFLAGEACQTGGQNGTVDSAIASGEAAACKVLAAFEAEGRTVLASPALRAVK